jgi:hypothetical protein
LQNRLIQTSQTGGQWYSDTSPFSIPWINSQTNVRFWTNKPNPTSTKRRKDPRKNLSSVRGLIS